MEKKEVVEQGEKRKGIEERERERNVLDDPHNNILSQVCWPRCSQRARPICSHHPPLSLSLFSSPPLLSLSRRTFCPIYPLCLGCNARAGKSREWEENGGGREEEEERKGNARTVRGNKLALRHTLLDVPLLSQFLFRIVSPPLCILACSRSSRTGRSCCLAFRCSVIFPPGIRFCSLFTNIQEWICPFPARVHARACIHAFLSSVSRVFDQLENVRV